MTANMPRSMASALRAAGWVKVDSYLWLHGETRARFMPYQMRGQVVEWTRWHEAGRTPGAGYNYFTCRDIDTG